MVAGAARKEGQQEPHWYVPTPFFFRTNIYVAHSTVTRHVAGTTLMAEAHSARKYDGYHPT